MNDSYTIIYLNDVITPIQKPYGQTVAYVRVPEGTLIALETHME